MTELLTAAQMRAIEQAAIESGEVTGLELMERAGHGVVEAVFEEWPELAATSHKAVVLCGPGNNGGDGFVVARLLKEWGWEVEVFLYGDADKLPPDAKVNCERWLKIGTVKEATSKSVLVAVKRHGFDVCFDAVFGAGLKRPPEREVEGLFSATRTIAEPNSFYCKRVAIDCPSCFDLDSGFPLLRPNIWEGDLHLDFFADLTVTFHALKIGHLLGGLWAYNRKVRVADIGLESNSDSSKEVVQLVDPSSHRMQKDYREHKYSHGHALVLSGGSGKTGAARLAARGALRIGAGLVTLGVPGSAQMEVASQITAVMLRRAGTAEELAKALEDERINALCLGPALGLERAQELVPVALEAKRATVLDADALSAFADDPSELFGMLHESCVLTPHGGEFATLFPDLAEKLAAPAEVGPAYSKVDATREAAKRAGCVVLYKGADTVIAAPDGCCSINAALYERAAPWLATAGAGDVLAGFITGLLARGFTPMQAAETGAWLHVECARSFGAGLIAEDLPEELPKVFKALGV